MGYVQYSYDEFMWILIASPRASVTDDATPHFQKILLNPCKSSCMLGSEDKFLAKYLLQFVS